jgi:hypothetical protein
MQIDAPPFTLLGTGLLASSQFTPSQKLGAEICASDPDRHTTNSQPSKKAAGLQS